MRRAGIVLLALLVAACGSSPEPPRLRAALPSGQLAIPQVLDTTSTTFSVGDEILPTTGAWTRQPMQFSYQWQDCNAAGASCVNIPEAKCVNIGTGCPYYIHASDIGDTLRVAVAAVTAAGSSTPAYSSVSRVVSSTIPTVSYTGPTTISGLARVTASATLSTPVTSVTWLLDAKPIGTSTVPSGAHSYAFTVNSALYSRKMHVIGVTATGETGAAVSSPATKITIGTPPAANDSNPSHDGKIVHLSGAHSGFTVGAGTTVYGDGPGSTVLTGNVTLQKGSVLQNVTVDGLISAVNAADATMQNVTQNGTSGSAAVTIANSPHLRIEESTVNCLGGASSNDKGIAAIDDPRSTNLVIAYNTVENCGGDGMQLITSGNHDAIVPGMDNMMILGNKVTGANGAYRSGTQARGIIAGGENGSVFYNTVVGGTTDAIETYNDAVNMDVGYNDITDPAVGLYMEHFTNHTEVNNNIIKAIGGPANTGRAIGGRGVTIEWLAGSPMTSVDDTFINNDIQYTTWGIDADAGTVGIVVGPGNVFRGPAAGSGSPTPAPVLFAGSTHGRVANNSACAPENGVGPFLNDFANGGFNPAGNVTVSSNYVSARC